MQAAQNAARKTNRSARRSNACKAHAAGIPIPKAAPEVLAQDNKDSQDRQRKTAGPSAAAARFLSGQRAP